MRWVFKRGVDSFGIQKYRFSVEKLGLTPHFLPNAGIKSPNLLFFYCLFGLRDHEVDFESNLFFLLLHMVRQRYEVKKMKVSRVF